MNTHQETKTTPLRQDNHDVVLKEDVEHGEYFEYEKALYEIFHEKLEAIRPPAGLKSRILEGSSRVPYTSA